MPLVEKTRGGDVYVRSLDRRFGIGDRADVTEAQAAYLCDERGDFQRVEHVTDVEYREVETDEDEGDEEDIEICGTEMSDGTTCERLAAECPYHGDDTEE